MGVLVPRMLGLALLLASPRLAAAAPLQGWWDYRFGDSREEVLRKALAHGATCRGPCDDGGPQGLWVRSHPFEAPPYRAVAVSFAFTSGGLSAIAVDLAGAGEEPTVPELKRLLGALRRKYRYHGFADDQHRFGAAAPTRACDTESEIVDGSRTYEVSLQGTLLSYFDVRRHQALESRRCARQSETDRKAVEKL